MPSLREKVFDRDMGQCARCKRETELLVLTAMREDGCTRREAIKTLGEYWGGGWAVKSLWQADHILPRHRGGGDGLENVQTLCLLCHKQKTGQLDVPAAAKDRRKRKKNQQHHERMARKAGR